MATLAKPSGSMKTTLTVAEMARADLARDAASALFAGYGPCRCGKPHSTIYDACTNPLHHARAETGVVLKWLESPLGPMIAAARDDGICLLEFNHRRRIEAQFAAVRAGFRQPCVIGTNRHLEQLERELEEYFARELREFTVPLVFSGTPFQVRVWQKLRKVPYGQTRSYQQLAKAAGNAAAVRAVGRANGMNRIAIVIPCHRIINKNGGLGGYAGGLHRKQFLLKLEQSSLF